MFATRHIPDDSTNAVADPLELIFSADRQSRFGDLQRVDYQLRHGPRHGPRHKPIFFQGFPRGVWACTNQRTWGGRRRGWGMGDGERDADRQVRRQVHTRFCDNCSKDWHQLPTTDIGLTPAKHDHWQSDSYADERRRGCHFSEQHYTDVEAW